MCEALLQPGRVVLRRVGFNTSEPPTSGPVITGGQSKYHVNDTVDLAPQELLKKERPYMAQDGLLTQISRLTFVARPFHFQRGVLRIKCVAEISGQRLAHHTTIPDTFRAWEKSFQASGGGRGVVPSLALLASCITLCATFTTSTTR
ncbi:hypothetical protein Hamer_G012736 [Homarus americanus]|uniref:Uncharacterized protein n=1 Tax=Homarus americanus TaxID=6706 RepID=A0A8J5MR15_HOMAM|nr:hypothetical protein Hamer_G012736 [Homarus americanus]